MIHRRARRGIDAHADEPTQQQIAGKAGAAAPRDILGERDNPTATGG